MSRKIWIYPILLFTFCIVTFWAHAQTEQVENRYPRLNEGTMFTVKLIPMASRLEVYIVGKQVAKVEIDRFGLFATMKIGNKIWQLEPKRSGDHFILEAPGEVQGERVFDLKLRVREGSKSEVFEFEDVPSRP